MAAVYYTLLILATGIMGAGLHKALRLRSTAAAGAQRKAAGLLAGLVGFFLAGYLVTPFATPAGHEREYLLVAAIYLAGAVFVLLVLRLVGGLVGRVRDEVGALHHRVEIESLLQVISAGFVVAAPEEIDAAIDQALEAIGGYAGADRCFVHLLAAGGRELEITHEWCGPGVAPLRGRLPPVPAADLPWLLERLRRFETIPVPDVAALPREAAAEREAWARLGIGSLLAVPLVSRRALAGFMGFAAAGRGQPWSQEDMGLYVVASDLLGGAVERKRSAASLREGEAALRRAKEELERQNEELRRLDQMKDGLIRDVSHELKTPVAKHAMQLEILRGIVGSHTLEPAEERALRVMEESVRRQQSVIRNLLDLARLESGGRRFAHEPVRLDEVVAKVVADYEHAAEVCGAAVTVAVPPLEVRSDEEMLWHVFSNLLNNALKFRRRDVPPRIVVAAEDGEGRVRVRVEDNGIGLAPEERERLFTRFYRASASREGTGLGLTICQRILGELGGGIEVGSDGPGRGATVIVTLPRG